MLQKLKKFWRHNAGNTIMIFALAVPAIFIAIGGAIDFSGVMQAKSQLQDAADVASVGSIAVNSPAFKAGLLITSGDLPIGVTRAQSIFASNLQPQKDVSNIKVTATVTKTNNIMTSVVNAKGTYKTYMLGLMGLSTLPVEVNSKSTATVPPYIDFYLLLDNTPSMGLGATPSDITLLQSKTPGSCAFACHETDKPGSDNYSAAKLWGVTMRIDVVRQATQSLMTTAKNTESLAGQYRMAIYDFGQSATAIDAQAPPPYNVSPLTTDLTTSATKAGLMDLMITSKQNYNSDRLTNFNSTLAGMKSIIPTSGDGTTSTKPQQVLFFVTDGVNDSYDCSRNDGATCRATTPLDPTQCTAIKAKGIRIAVLYTTYQPVPSDSWYTSYVAPWRPANKPDLIAAEMQACATDGLYFEVSPSQGISDALNALFTKVISVVRINS